MLDHPWTRPISPVDLAWAHELGREAERSEVAARIDAATSDLVATIRARFPAGELRAAAEEALARLARAAIHPTTLETPCTPSAEPPPSPLPPS